jgi:phage tail-like protein
MNVGKLKCYRFANEAQWNACLFARADRDSRRTSGGIRPQSPYEQPGTQFESNGAYAPVVTRAGDILWRDNNCAIHRLSKCADRLQTSAAPVAIARAERMVSTSSGLWVFGTSPESLQRYAEDTLARLLTVDVPQGGVVDIANGGQGCVLALIERDGVWQSVRVDRFGHIVETIEFKGVSDAKGFVYLRRSKRFVVWAGKHHPRLYWFSAEGGASLFSLAVAAMRPCFQDHALGSDSMDKVFLAGADGDQFGGRAYVLTFGADGNRLAELPLETQDALATGITASRDLLLVTWQSGLLKCRTVNVVPEDAEPVECKLMTPVLFSPDREDKRRWLRIEANMILPEGCTLEICWAATDDTPTRDRLSAMTADGSIPSSQRIENLLSEPDLRRGRTVFHGVASARTPDAEKFSAKLFDVNERYLWVCIALTASAGARLPLLSELAVLYPGRTLMEDLPSIYQREEERPDSFLRALVGVLETTTQGLDARIGSLGRHIHPSTADGPWLNYIARWLGVPWDDALTQEQKKRLLRRAPDLAKNRGTRAGLEAMLESLIPDKPWRFRVTDATADFGFAIVGDESCAGSSLPAILAGSRHWRAKLNSTAVLGFMRLDGAGESDDGVSKHAGRIRVDVAATAAEKQAWDPWLLALITEMVPLAARVELRWVAPRALCANRLDGTLMLESDPVAHLGTDAITGRSRLPEGETHITSQGPGIGARLH